MNSFEDISKHITLQNVKALIVCFLFMVIGPTLILVNQYILKELKFPYPMFLSGLGVLASGCLARVLVLLRVAKLEKTEAVEGMLWFKRVLPVGIAHAGTLAMGNMIYLYLNVGFIQMLKAFTPVVLILTSYVANIGIPNQPTIYSVIVISVGTAAACSYSPEVNVIGLILMFFAEFFEGVRLILTQFFLQQLKFGVIEGQYVLAPASAFWLFVASSYFELPIMIEKDAFQILFDNPGTFLVASFMGIGVNFMSYLVIQLTSSLTLKVLGVLRSVGLVCIGILFYGEEVTTNEMIGYFIAVCGLFGYNLAQVGYFDKIKMDKSSSAEKDIKTSQDSTPEDAKV